MKPRLLNPSSRNHDWWKRKLAIVLCIISSSWYLAKIYRNENEFRSISFGYCDKSIPFSFPFISQAHELQTVKVETYKSEDISSGDLVQRPKRIETSRFGFDSIHLIYNKESSCLFYVLLIVHVCKKDFVCLSLEWVWVWLRQESNTTNQPQEYVWFDIIAYTEKGLLLCSI